MTRLSLSLFGVVYVVYVSVVIRIIKRDEDNDEQIRHGGGGRRGRSVDPKGRGVFAEKKRR